MFRAISICLFSLLLLACSNSSSVASSETTQHAIINTTLVYVKNHTAIPTAKVRIAAIMQSGNYARVRIDPIDPITDSAFAFLKQTPQGWKVISLGTAFDKNFYMQYHVPKELQL